MRDNSRCLGFPSDKNLTNNSRSEEKRDAPEKRNVDIESYPCKINNPSLKLMKPSSNTKLFGKYR
jgi:hypothetical protein